MRKSNHRKTGLTASVCLVAMTMVASSDNGHGRHHHRKGGDQEVHQDEILEASKRGEIRPLADITTAALKVLPGQVVGVKVKKLEGRLVYEFKIVTEKGRLREVYVDAATVEIVKVE